MEIFVKGPLIDVSFKYVTCSQLVRCLQDITFVVDWQFEKWASNVNGCCPLSLLLMPSRILCRWGCCLNDDVTVGNSYLMMITQDHSWAIVVWV